MAGIGEVDKKLSGVDSGGLQLLTLRLYLFSCIALTLLKLEWAIKMEYYFLTKCFYRD